MLFIGLKEHGQGIGKQLLEYALNERQVNEVDVNEQNPQAISFYCNDPAVSAQVRLLMHKLQQVFSFSTPGVGVYGYVHSPITDTVLN